jgi:hypothetical protein
VPGVMMAVCVEVYTCKVRTHGAKEPLSFWRVQINPEQNLKVVRTMSTKPDNQSRAAMLSSPASQGRCHAGPLPRRE